MFNACKMLSSCDYFEVHVVDMVEDINVSELLSVFDYENDSPEQSMAFIERVPLLGELTESWGR